MSGLGAARGPASQEVSQVDIEIHEDGRPVIVWGNVKDKDTENLVKLCVRAREEGRKLRPYVSNAPRVRTVIALALAALLCGPWAGVHAHPDIPNVDGVVSFVAKPPSIGSSSGNGIVLPRVVYSVVTVDAVANVDQDAESNWQLVGLGKEAGWIYPLDIAFNIGSRDSRQKLVLARSAGENGTADEAWRDRIGFLAVGLDSLTVCIDGRMEPNRMGRSVPVVLQGHSNVYMHLIGVHSRLWADGDAFKTNPRAAALVGYPRGLGGSISGNDVRARIARNAPLSRMSLSGGLSEGANDKVEAHSPNYGLHSSNGGHYRGPLGHVLLGLQVIVGASIVAFGTKNALRALDVSARRQFSSANSFDFLAGVLGALAGSIVAVVGLIGLLT
jgi:hypothetical protein